MAAEVYPSQSQSTTIWTFLLLLTHFQRMSQAVVTLFSSKRRQLLISSFPANNQCGISSFLIPRPQRTCSVGESNSSSK